MKKIFQTKNAAQLETISRACSLGYYRNKLYSKIDKYFTHKRCSSFLITFHLLFYNLKSLLRFNLPYKSEYSDDLCHILLSPGGGMGDHIYFLKYCFCLRKKFGDAIRIDVLIRKNDRYLVDQLYKNANYIDSVFEDKCSNHDVVINLTRFPEIKKVDLKRIKRISSQDLLEYLFCVAQFKLDHNEFYRSDFLGRCYSQICKNTRENQADIGNFLKMSSVTDFSISSDENVIKSTLLKFGLEQDTYVVLQTGSGHHFQKVKQDTRQWPVEYYYKLISLLKKNHPNIKFVQCGEPYHNRIGNVDIDLVGKTSLEEVFVLIKCAKLLISAEGGYPIIRHFISRKASCVLFGPTNKDFFGFDENLNISANVCFGCEWLFETWYSECVVSENQAVCMRSLRPEAVVECIEQERMLK